MAQRIVVVGLALAVTVLAAGAIALNLLLLDHADSRNDPVGKLTPRARISEVTPPASTPTTTHDHAETEVGDPDD